MRRILSHLDGGDWDAIKAGFLIGCGALALISAPKAMAAVLRWLV